MTTLTLTEEERQVALSALEGYSPVPRGKGAAQDVARRARTVAVDLAKRIRSTP